MRGRFRWAQTMRLRRPEAPLTLVASLLDLSPRAGRGEKAISFPRCLRIRVLCTKPLIHASPNKGGRQGAKRRTAGYRIFRCGARLGSVLSPCTEENRGHRDPLEQARSPFGAPPRFPRRLLGPLGLGSSQRFLESPDANGRTLSGTSAASTSQTGIGPDRHDAQAARERNVSFRPREPPPLRLQEYPREKRPSSSGICAR
jgi:hypothetical protein